jgi:CO/xanthine dehydrogenase FAD-binding subunit
LATIDLFLPSSIDEAVGLLQQHGSDLVVMGGGTVIMGMVNDGLLFPRVAMSLQRAGLNAIRRVNNHTEIGATATIARLSQLDGFPLLARAASIFGSPAIRNMATVGGNMFLPSPYGDMAVPLLALDAQAEFTGPNGRYVVALDQFLAGRTRRAPDELLTAIHVPNLGGTGEKSAYLKYGRRQANTPSVVAVAVRVTTDSSGKCSHARIALGAAGPHVMRAYKAESALLGQVLNESSITAAAQIAMEESDPPTDALASAWYRRKMVGVYVRRAFEQAAN